MRTRQPFFIKGVTNVEGTPLKFTTVVLITHVITAGKVVFLWTCLKKKVAAAMTFLGLVDILRLLAKEEVYTQIGLYCNVDFQQPYIPYKE